MLSIFVCLLFLGTTSSLGLASTETSGKRDSLLKILATLPEERQLLVYDELTSYTVILSAVQAQPYAERGLALARKYGDSASVAYLLSQLAYIRCVSGDFAWSLAAGQYALALSKRYGDSAIRAAAHNSLGIVYNFMGEYSKALEHHYQALAIREQLGKPLLIARTCNNIGTVFHRLGQYNKALTFYKRAKIILRTFENNPSVIRTTHNIGFAFFKLGQYDSAMRYHLEGLVLAQKYHAGSLSYSYYNIGLVYIATNHLDNAIEYLNRAYHLYLESSETYGQAETLNSLAEAHEKAGNISRSIAMSQKAIHIAKNIRAPDQLRDAYQHLYILHCCPR